MTRERIAELEEEVKTLRFEYGMLQISFDTKSRLLDSCEKALAKRDDSIKIKLNKINRLQPPEIDA